MSSEYLLELRSDEMPTDLLQPLLRRFTSRLFEDLMSLGLGPGEIITGTGPRRLFVCCRGLKGAEPDREKRVLGPSRESAWNEDGTPSEALQGFLERVEVDLSEVLHVKTEKGEYTAVLHKGPGRSLHDVLVKMVPDLLAESRWGGQRIRWREDAVWGAPLRGILSLLDGSVAAITLDGVEASDQTSGHPTLSPDPFQVTDFDDYLARLSELGIEPRYEVRRAKLKTRLREAAAERGAVLARTANLLDRLALNCEIPGVVIGDFDVSYLDLHEEVLLSILSDRQSVYPLYREGTSELLPAFAAVIDRPGDPSGHVRHGLELAVAGRLSDARFYGEIDRKTPLTVRAGRLDQLIYHPQLGHYADRQERISALVDLMARELGWDNEIVAAQEAAMLLKADLTTRTVRDDGQLRGRMGGLLARREGYLDAVWQAVYDQYKPGSSEETIPRGRVGRLVAAADRIDSLVGSFGLGEVPTGSKDPQGLRRRMQGLLRIVIEGEMPLDLDLIAARAVVLYGDKLERPAEDILSDLQKFFFDRVRHLLGQRAFAVDEIEAAMAIGRRDIPDLEARLRALRTVREDPEFRSLVLAAKRISNMVKDSPEFELSAELFHEEAEKDFYEELVEVRRAVDESADAKQYEDCLRYMMPLVPLLDRFFAEVLVMAEDEMQRQNRIALLQLTRRVFWRLARLKEMAIEAADLPSLDDTRLL